MKVLINRRVVEGNWGGGNHFVRAFRRYIPSYGFDIVESLSNEPDVVVCVGENRDEMGIGFWDIAAYKHLMRDRVKTIVRINENDARKNTVGVDNTMMRMMTSSDGSVFVTNWLRDYYRTRFCESLALLNAFNTSTVIYNGVDEGTFYQKTKTNVDKSEKKIVSCHWSDNPMKGQDYTEMLDHWVDRHPGFRFTFVGRTQAIFKGRNSFKIGPMFGKDLGDELRKHDICINASRFDPGPNSVIESISCGLPTYVHVDGGGGVEFAGTDHVFRNCSELEEILLSPDHEENKTKFSSWDECISSYVEYIRKL